MRKELKIIMITMLCFTSMLSSAQEGLKSISPCRIVISYDKTTNLIFPYTIKSVDRGSSAVLAQKAVAVENILQLKAGSKNFKETNVTVITGDGHFYSFLVTYADSPVVVNYSFDSDSSETEVLTGQTVSESIIQTTANAIKKAHPSLHMWVRVEDMKLSVDNLFIKDDVMWIKLSLQNKSAIPYMPSYIRFYLGETKRVKRTAVQENELVSLLTTAFEKVATGSKQTLVCAFHPFTIPENKRLVIQIGEEKGSRLLILKLSHRLMHKIREL